MRAARRPTILTMGGRWAALFLAAVVLTACGPDTPVSDTDPIPGDGGARSGFIEGTVTSSAGGPVAGASIGITSADGANAVPEIGITTGADGRYRGPGLGPGAYTVVAIEEGYKRPEPAPARVVAGQATTVDIVLEPEP